MSVLATQCLLGADWARAGLRARGGREPVIRACPRGDDGVGEGGPAELNTWSLPITVGWEGRARCPEGEAFLKQGHEARGCQESDTSGRSSIPGRETQGGPGAGSAQDTEAGVPCGAGWSGRDPGSQGATCPVGTGVS